MTQSSKAGITIFSTQGDLCMTNQISTIDTGNYDAMAKVMGMSGEKSSDKAKSTLARLRMNHSPIMGNAKINGKMVNVEKVSGGTYKLENVETGDVYYTESVNIRPYMQRFMYKRFVKGIGMTKNMFIKTVMNDSLNVDLKDNSGGLNCGKPTGYIQDFGALPEDMQNLIRQIKRVRVVFGTIDLIDPVNENGDPVNKELKNIPFIWEIDNKEAFKHVGGPFQTLLKQKRLPVQHTLSASSEERKLPNGNSFYVPVVSLNLSESLDISVEVQTRFSDFVSWITNYNEYITSAWEEQSKNKFSDEDSSIIEDFMDIDEADSVVNA